MSQVGSVFFITYVSKPLEFHLCVFKTFINAGTSQLFCTLQAWQQQRKKTFQMMESAVLWGPDLFSILPTPPEKQRKWSRCISQVTVRLQLF